VSVRSDVLLWAQRIVARKGAQPHQLLEISSDAGLEVAQDAFHKIARIAHPDLHRNSLTEEELELITTAYSRVAAAYQDLRNLTLQTGRLPPLREDPPPPRSRTSPGQTTQRVPPVHAGAAGSSPDAASPEALKHGPAGAMSSKALLHYRKAELCLRRGDLKGAVLQLKMAIACDPQSAFLRTALAEVEAEVGK
jgi:curved DNA-binding protein CbpA